MTESTLHQRNDDADADAIAVIAINGRFPGANSIEQFWENLDDGKESITFFSDEELASAGVDQIVLRDARCVKARGLVRGIEGFDAAFFGLSLRDAMISDPQHRIFLECAWELLERAGYDSQIYRGSVGVFAGSAVSSYLLNNLWPNVDLVQSADPYYVLLANDKDHLTTRVAYKLDLRGPCVTVQTACSTSLVALHLACQSLLNRECDMALAGGVALSIPQVAVHLYEESSKNSPDGHSRAFDARARGTVQSEGAALVLLKRLGDAIEDGDAIYAIVRGSAINNDGAGKVSYAAPSVDGQADVIRGAQLLANVSAESIDYVECHGTATELGDPIEIAALTKAFRGSTTKERFCAIGSLKTNVGHMDCASGMAGFIKTVLALSHERMPPSLHFESPNPAIDFEHSPFFVNTEVREWKRSERRRVAGVSSFGVGGTNAHVVVEEAPLLPGSDPAPEWQLLMLSAKTGSALEQSTAALLEYLRSKPDLNLADLAFTLQVGRRPFEHRRFLACKDIADAIAALETRSPQSVFTSHVDRERPVVFLFPGQGPQYEHMGSQLYEREPVFRTAIRRCAELLRAHLDRDIVAFFERQGTRTPSAASPSAELSQPVLFAFEYALAELWLSWGVKPQAYVGHSMGEYVAATLAGVFELEDALRVIVLRERLIQSLPRGAIVTVLQDEAEVLPLLPDGVAVSAFNGPGLYSISGSVAAVDNLQRTLEARGVVHSRLPVSHVSHCSVVDPILAPFREIVASVRLRQPQTPYLSNVTGGWIQGHEATDPEYWVRHLREPVQFSRAITTLLRDSSLILLEVGPGRTLASLIHQHEGGDEHVVITSLAQSRPASGEVEAILQALGKLWGAGGQIDRAALHRGSRRQRLVAPTYPFERRRCWVEAPRREGSRDVVAPVAGLPEPPLPSLGQGGEGEVHELTETQAVVLQFWQDLLGVARVGVHDDFFDLGGNSLLGIKLHTRIKQEFAVEIALKHLLEKTTVAGMSEAIEVAILEEIESLEK